jgi:hypothetical protein
MPWSAQRRLLGAPSRQPVDLLTVTLVLLCIVALRSGNGVEAVSHSRTQSTSVSPSSTRSRASASPTFSVTGDRTSSASVVASRSATASYATATRPATVSTTVTESRSLSLSASLTPGTLSTTFSSTRELEITSTATPASLMITAGTTQGTTDSGPPPNTVYEAAIRSGYPLQDRVLLFILRGARFAEVPPNSAALFPSEGAFLRRCISLDTSAAPALATYYSVVWTDATLAVRRPPKVIAPGLPQSSLYEPDVLSVTFTTALAFQFSSSDANANPPPMAPPFTQVPVNVSTTPRPPAALAPSGSVDAFEHIPAQYIAPKDPSTVPFAVLVHPACLAANAPGETPTARTSGATVRSDVAFLRRGAAHRSVRGPLAVPGIAATTVAAVTATLGIGVAVATVFGPAAAPVFGMCAVVNAVALLSLAYGDGRILLADPSDDAAGVAPSRAVGTYTVVRMLFAPPFIASTGVGFGTNQADESIVPRADEGQNTPQGPLETTIGAVANTAFVVAVVAMTLLVLLGLVLPGLTAVALRGSDFAPNFRLPDVAGDAPAETGQQSAVEGDSAGAIVRRAARGRGVLSDEEADEGDDGDTARMVQRVNAAVLRVRREQGGLAIPPSVDALVCLLSRCTFAKAAAALAVPSRLGTPFVALAVLSLKLSAVALFGAAEGVLGDWPTLVACSVGLLPVTVFWVIACAVVLSPTWFGAEGLVHDPYEAGRAATEAGRSRKAAARERVDVDAAATTRLWRRWARVFFPSAVAAEETRHRYEAMGLDGDEAVEHLQAATWRSGQQRREAVEAARLGSLAAAKAERGPRKAGTEHSLVADLADAAFARRTAAFNAAAAASGNTSGILAVDDDGDDAGARVDGIAADRSSWYQTVRAFHRFWLAWGVSKVRWRSKHTGMTPDGGGSGDVNGPNTLSYFAEANWGFFGDARGPRRWAVVLTIAVALLLAILEATAAATTVHRYYGIAVGRITTSGVDDAAERSRRLGGPLTASDGVTSDTNARLIAWLAAGVLVAHLVAMALLRPFASPLRNVLQGVVGLLQAAAAVAIAFSLGADEPFLNFPGAVSLVVALRYRALLTPATLAPDGGGNDGAASNRFIPSVQRLAPAAVEIPDLPWRDAATRVLLASVLLVLVVDMLCFTASRICFEAGRLLADAAWHASRQKLLDAEAALLELRDQAAALSALSTDPAALDARRVALLRDIVQSSPLMKRGDAHLLSLEEVAGVAAQRAAVKRLGGEASELGLLLGGGQRALRRATRASEALEAHINALLVAQGQQQERDAARVTLASVHVPLPPASSGIGLMCVLQALFCCHVSTVTAPSLVRFDDALRRQAALRSDDDFARAERAAATSPLLRLLSATGGTTAFADDEAMEGDDAPYFLRRGGSYRNPLDRRQPVTSPYAVEMSGVVRHHQPPPPPLRRPSPNEYEHHSPPPRRPENHHFVEMTEAEAQDLLQYL